jgi:hypothetical protein
MVNLSEMDVSLYPAAVKAQLFALEAEYKEGMIYDETNLF